MDVTWMAKYVTEFLGTAILIILGNGAVANVELKGTKGHQSGWLVIAVGYGMGTVLSSQIHRCTLQEGRLPCPWTTIQEDVSILR